MRLIKGQKGRSARSMTDPRGEASVWRRASSGNDSQQSSECPCGNTHIFCKPAAFELTLAYPLCSVRTGAPRYCNTASTGLRS